MSENIWIEVNLVNLAYNLKALRARTSPSVKIMAVVKQNAYGHGIIGVAEKLSKEKVDFLGVHSVGESLNLLDSRIRTPTLILSNTLSFKELALLLRNKIRFTVMGKNLLRHLNRIAKKENLKALIHIKTDTGMGRLGLEYKNASAFIEEALSLRNIKIEGLYSHLSSAEDDPVYTNYQIKKFKLLLVHLRKKNVFIRLAHICNSAGIVNFKDAHFDMVRSGLLLYGIKPHHSLKIKVKPILRLKTRIVHIKKVTRNSFVSYGNTFKTKKDTLTGIIACGYAYGYPWSLSGKTSVLIKGKKCPILGRICMDHMVVNLNSLAGKVHVGDEVTLIGKDGQEEITVEELAKKANTIPYEIVSCLSYAIKRIYSRTAND